jgi:anthranilate synthase component 1
MQIKKVSLQTMYADPQSSLVIKSLDAAPDLLALHANFPERYPFLLQSAASGTAQGRYDILFGFPGETLCLNGDGRLIGPGADANSDFVSALDAWTAGVSESVIEHSTPPAEQLPFIGGWFLYLSYELAGQLERRLTLPIEPAQPVAMATRVPAAIIIDHQTSGSFVLSEPGSSECIDTMLADIALVLSQPQPQGSHTEHSSKEEDPEHFISAVEQAKQHISDGDIYQANLSRQWHAPAHGKKAWELYSRLCTANPAPFAGLASFGAGQGLDQPFSIISSSPERLVAVRDGQVDTRPIAGTRPRHSAAPMSDAELAEFLGHPKERAEHIMLIDLERNDLGRICNGGSVRVSEFMAIESYSHVHHLVSNVVGDLRIGVSIGDIIRAVFPGGTITGCPKVRCMQIIAEQEGRPRGAYTGSMGYLNIDGSCDLSILIRTMVLKDDQITLAAGSGIVADSDPQTELNETRAKAKGLLLAIS